MKFVQTYIQIYVRACSLSLFELVRSPIFRTRLPAAFVCVSFGYRLFILYLLFFLICIIRFTSLFLLLLCSLIYLTPAALFAFVFFGIRSWMKSPHTYLSECLCTYIRTCVCTHITLWVCSSLSLIQCAYSVLAAGGLIKRLVTLAINLAAILAFCLYS